MAKETYSYGKRDLFIWQKRPTRDYVAKKDLPASPPRRLILRRVSYGKRDLLIWQKRPTHMAKETYSYGKRDLSYGKRDLSDDKRDLIHLFEYIHLVAYNIMCVYHGVRK